MADKPAFTITSYEDADLKQRVAAGEFPEGSHLRHNLLDADGKVVAVGMSDAEARQAIAARHGSDVSGHVKSGALGHKADAAVKVADLAK
jgi:hypothetical protein